MDVRVPFPSAAERTPLARPRSSTLSGVSVALADHLNTSVALVRFMFVIMAMLGGAGAMFYVWLWALTPLRPSAAKDAETPVTHRVNLAFLFALVGVSAGVVTVGGVISAGSNVAASALILASVALLAAVAWAEFVTQRGVVGLSPPQMRVAAGVYLMGIALLALSIRPADPTPELWLAFVIAICAAAAALFAPWTIKLWRELITERTARIRQEQRAEIAAHLHDSVLQTLALIQNRAGASSEVGRLARAQERELREWLYADTAPATSHGGIDLVGELQQVALLLEVEYPAHFDVVSVGPRILKYPAELSAAAREAMVNAAHHVGGDISVYVETIDSVVNVYVRDRGEGFDVATIPDGRLGVRESIIGRMRRVGGQATVTSNGASTTTAGVQPHIRGTEVHLSVEWTTGSTGSEPESP